MSWRETSLYLCTASLYLEKVVSSKLFKFAIETDVERKARLEKMVAITQLRLTLETEEERRAKKGMNLIKLFFFSRTELARPVMGTFFLTTTIHSIVIVHCSCYKLHSHNTHVPGLTTLNFIPTARR